MNNEAKNKTPTSRHVQVRGGARVSIPVDMLRALGLKRGGIIQIYRTGPGSCVLTSSKLKNTIPSVALSKFVGSVEVTRAYGDYGKRGAIAAYVMVTTLSPGMTKDVDKVDIHYQLQKRYRQRWIEVYAHSADDTVNAPKTKAVKVANTPTQKLKEYEVTGSRTITDIIPAYSAETAESIFESKHKDFEVEHIREMPGKRRFEITYNQGKGTRKFTELATSPEEALKLAYATVQGLKAVDVVGVMQVE